MKFLARKPFAAILFAVSLFALLTSGCGVTKSYVRLAYSPAAETKKVTDGPNNVQVKIADKRAVKDHIGRKGYEYSFLGPIVAENDVPTLVANAFETELVNRGFTVAESQISVALELHKFFAEYKPKGLSEEIVGEVVLGVQVGNGSGSIAFAKTVTGEGRTHGSAIRSGQDVKKSLEQALDSAVKQVLNDEAFTRSLVNTTRASVPGS